MDDGSTDEGITFFNVNGIWIQQFTPPFYPYYITDVCVSLFTFNRPMITSLPYNIVIYDSVAGKPNTPLYSQRHFAANLPDSYHSSPQVFYNVNVSSGNVVIASGSVYVGVQIDTLAFPFVYLAYDTTASTTQQTMRGSNDDGLSWIDVEDIPFGIRAFFIRIDGTLGGGEGEGGGGPSIHHADRNGDGSISLSELLRVVQLYNMGIFQCDELGEDGFNLGLGDTSCVPHSSDYNPQDWFISFDELLRLIQLYNAFGYYSCPSVGEDNFCPGGAL